jgi:uncharacterized protein (DUF58 family)
MTWLSYRLYLLATALNYRLPRRLTKAGLLAIVSIMLVGAIGTDMESSMAFQAFALLFCLLIVGWVWTPWFRGRFSLERSLPRLATVGQPFRYRVQIRNLGARAYRSLEWMEDLADPRPSLAEFTRLIHPTGRMRAFRLAKWSGPKLDNRQATVSSPDMPHLAAQGTAIADVEVVPLRRGPLRFRGVTMARRDPLGLVRGFVKTELSETVLVLPKRYPVPSLGFAGNRQYQPGGVALASSIGESEEFVSLRDYRPGDPFRRIHWRSWARTGRPIVKEYQDEYFIRYGLLLDTFARPDQADVFEEAVSVAASFACTLADQECLLDLLFVGSQAFCFTTGRGLGQPEQALEILASVQPAVDQPFASLRELVLRHVGVLAGCVCVFVTWDAARRDLVRQLQAAGLPVLPLVVTEPLSDDPPLNDDAEPQVEIHQLTAGRIAEDLRELRWSPS